MKIKHLTLTDCDCTSVIKRGVKYEEGKVTQKRELHPEGGERGNYARGKSLHRI